MDEGGHVVGVELHGVFAAVDGRLAGAEVDLEAQADPELRVKAGVVDPKISLPVGISVLFLAAHRLLCPMTSALA